MSLEVVVDNESIAMKMHDAMKRKRKASRKKRKREHSHNGTLVVVVVHSVVASEGVANAVVMVVVDAKSRAAEPRQEVFGSCTLKAQRK